MPKGKTKQAKVGQDTAANVGYEAQLWQMADALRGSMDAAEYKHVVLGLIFLKYISDAGVSAPWLSSRVGRPWEGARRMDGKEPRESWSKSPTTLG